MVLQPPTCSPTVVETGYTTEGHGIEYGLVVENSCPFASVGNHISVEFLDKTGNRVDDEHTGLGATLSVLLPGQRSGVARSAELKGTGPAPDIATMHASVTSNRLLPASVFAAWPRSVTTQDIAIENIGPRDASITATIATDPADASLCMPNAELILRDHEGRIVAGEETPVTGHRISIKFTIPTGTDLGRLQLFIVQGGPGFPFGVGEHAMALGIAHSYACG